jgi:hypothetical protein
MIFNHDDPATWPVLRPTIIAHDVGRSRDRSTAVVGGLSPVQPTLLGIQHLEELPQGLYGSARANALAEIDRRYLNNALIVADLSNDASYAEVLWRTFGRRAVGLHITRHGNGTTFEMRDVLDGFIPVYSIGRTALIERYLAELERGEIRTVNNEMSRLAYQQLADLEVEDRGNERIYTCLSGRHDDLGISCAMVAWAARHPHLSYLIGNLERSRIRRKRAPVTSWAAWT